MALIDWYNANSVKPGDILVVTVKVMVQYDGTFRIYRCPWPNAEIGEEGDPQGDALISRYPYDLEVLAETLFPVLETAKGPDLTI